MTTERTTAEPLAKTLRDAITRLGRRVRQARPVGDLTFSQLSALTSLQLAGALTPRELADTERVQPPTMTKIVARLEAAGLVVREVDVLDRRVARVRVTPAGHRFVERGRQRGATFLASRLRTLSPEERAVVDAALPVLERLLEDEA